MSVELMFFLNVNHSLYKFIEVKIIRVNWLI